MLFLLLFILVGFVFFEIYSKEKSSKFYYRLIILVAFVEGIRWYSGVDFFMYYNSYQKVLDISTEMHNNRYDVLYLYLSKFFKIVGLHYTFFLLFISFLGLFLQSGFIIKFTSFPIHALLINFVCLIGFLGNNRQFIALSIVFYATHFLINGKKNIFIVLLILASGFHFTAIFLVIFLFLDKEISLKKWFFCTLLVLLTCFIPLKEIVLNYLQDYERFFPFLKERFFAYESFNYNDIDWKRFTLGIIRKIFVVAFLLLFKERLNKLRGYTFLLNISILSALIYLWANFNFTYLLGRFIIYFSIYECVIYSWIGFLFIGKKPVIKYVTLVLFSFFWIFLFFKGIELYPDLFIPYKTIFFKF